MARAPGTRRRRRRRDDGGAVSTQVAIVPAVAALFFFVVQVSLWFYARSVATSAAQHGLDATRVEEGSEADGRDTVEQFVGQIGGLDVQRLTVSRSAEEASVTIEGEPVTVMPFFDVPIEVTLEAPVERVPEVGS
jgi:Flp pilus assembly protein TadG